MVDEPTEGVQPENIDRIARVLAGAKARGHAFILVEQNLSFIEQVADDVLVLDHGACRLAGPLAQWDRESLERHLVV